MTLPQLLVGAAGDATHALYLLPAAKTLPAALPQQALWQSVLKRRDAKIADLATSPQAVDLADGRRAACVMVDAKLPRFERLTALRKAVMLLLDESPAELAIVPVGVTDDDLRDAAYVALLNAAPLLASMAWDEYMASPDDQFLTDAFPRLLAFFKAWFAPARDQDSDGIPEWEHVLQTGFDENPLFDVWYPWSQSLNIQTLFNPELEALLFREASAQRFRQGSLIFDNQDTHKARLVLGSFRIAPQDESRVRGPALMARAWARKTNILSEMPRICANSAQDE